MKLTKAAYTRAMADSSGRQAAVIDGSDLTFLDRLEFRDHSLFLTLAAHQLYGHSHHAAIGVGILSPAWDHRKKKFSSEHFAQAYLHNFARSPIAMASLRTFAMSLNPGVYGPFSDVEVIAMVAASLVSKRAWLIEVPKWDPVKGSLVGKTSPGVFAALNPKFGTKVDFAFIASQEGDQWRVGYVPIGKSGVVLGRSGMTIASGFDMGQWAVKDMQGLGFPPKLIAKFKPFASPHNFHGKTTAQVTAEVAKLGPVPVLSAPEADIVDGAVFRGILADAISNWNSSKGAGVPTFTDLPSGWQTVWLSRLYNEGSNEKNLSTYARAFRTAATAGDWTQAIAKLRAYPGYANKRANQEADLLVKQLPPSAASGPKLPK